MRSCRPPHAATRSEAALIGIRSSSDPTRCRNARICRRVSVSLACMEPCGEPRRSRRRRRTRDRSEGWRHRGRPYAHAMPRGDSAQTVRATLALRQLVLDGEIAPGERLVELALVDRIGVSRTPLRLALTTLAHEGLVETLPGGGFVVRSFSRVEVDDAIELRGVLEGTAARFAAERLESPADLDEMRELTARLDEIVHDTSPEAILIYVELNEAFHAQLAALARSEIISREIRRVMAFPFASPASLIASHAHPSHRDLLIAAQHQHNALLEAIQAGHGTRAEEIAREHARISKRSLDLALEQREILDALPGAALLSVDADVPS